MEALGLELERIEPWGNLPLDHLALLFELVVQGGGDASPQSRQLAEHVSEQLLGPWVAQFGESLSAKSTQLVYRGLGVVLGELHGPEPKSEPAFTPLRVVDASSDG